MLMKTKYIYEKNLDGYLFLLNLLTFEYILLNHDDVITWKTEEFEKLSVSSILKEKLFLVEKDYLFDIVQRKMTRKGNLGSNHNIFITDECNQKCPYCFEKEIGALRKYNRVLNKFQVDKIFEMILKLNKKYARSDGKVILFGGEPLLLKNKEIVRYILEMSKQTNLAPVDIVTNGTTLQHFFDLILQYESTINGIIVTINGLKDVHERMRGSEENPSFNIIIKNLITLLSICKKITIQVNVLVGQGNVHNLGALLDYLREKDLLGNARVDVVFGRIQSRFHPDLGREKGELPYTDYYPNLLKLYFEVPNMKIEMLSGSEMDILGRMFRFWNREGYVVPALNACEAVYPGRYCYYVDGNIYPCTEIAGMSRYSIGNYIEGRMYKEEEKWRQYKVCQLAKCKECKYIAFCNGACPVSNLGMNGKIDDVYCLDIEEALDKMICTLYEKGYFKSEII